VGAERRAGLWPLLLWGAVLALAACQQGAEGPARVQVPGGDRERGRELLSVFGCIACHEIPGVAGEGAPFAPPLEGFAHRSYIAGKLPNEPQALVRWVMSPREVEPGTAMPDLGVNRDEALHMAAYLYSLE
jgi:cytochrome c